MIDIQNDDQYYIVFGKTDLRKGIDTLAIYLEVVFNQAHLIVVTISFVGHGRTVLKCFIGMVKASS